jgi:hypothetical protein
MAISEARKVDYLWKKIGYGVTKTDTNANLGPTNEPIASPLLLRGDRTWNQASNIPSTPPGSSSGVVTVYPTGSPIECSAVATATLYRSWNTNLTDWIPPEFNSQYLIKAYIHTAGDGANAVSSGDFILAAGSGDNDEYFFDYQSGVLHFIGSNLPNGINFVGKSVYIVGYRYTGTIGLQNNVADTGDFTFSGNTIATSSSNADFEMEASGTGKYVFTSDTGVVLPTGTTAQRPSAQEGIIRFNTDTGKYEVSQDGSTYTALRTDADAAEINKDVFTGDGSTTQFTMSITPTDGKNIIVYVDGVMQEDTRNYTITGNVLKFDGDAISDSSIEAPHDGARIVVMHGFAD